MKKKLSYICLLFLFAATTIYGQNSPSHPIRTAEEQAAFEKTIPVNPAKIAPETQVDSRMGPVQTSPTNWKPAIAPVDERKTAGISQTDNNTAGSSSEPVVNSSQPKGEQPLGKTVNRREVKPSATQPEAPKSGNVTNYRSLKGSATQPEGEKPKR